MINNVYIHVGCSIMDHQRNSGKFYVVIWARIRGGCINFNDASVCSLNSDWAQKLKDGLLGPLLISGRFQSQLKREWIRWTLYLERLKIHCSGFCELALWCARRQFIGNETLVILLNLAFRIATITINKISIITGFLWVNPESITTNRLTFFLNHTVTLRTSNTRCRIARSTLISINVAWLTCPIWRDIKSRNTRKANCLVAESTLWIVS